MNTKRILSYGLTAAVLAFVFPALFLTGCDNGNGITKTDPTVTWPQGLMANKGQALSEIALNSHTNAEGTPGAFSWTKPADVVGVYRAQLYNMTFTPADTANYNTVTKDVSIHICDEDPTYSTDESDVRWFLGWQWIKEDNDPIYEFKWIFKNDGTVTVVHCCGLEFPDNFSYFFCGNILVTYGSEMDIDTVEPTAFTKTETDNGVSFTRDNGISFTRGEPTTGSSSSSPIVLSNDLLGTWQDAEGTKYIFGSDTRLQISSPSADSGQYGYLVRDTYNNPKKLLTLGPLVDGTVAVLREYSFTKSGNTLTLTSSDGKQYSLSRLQ